MGNIQWSDRLDVGLVGGGKAQHSVAMISPSLATINPTGAYALARAGLQPMDKDLRKLPPGQCGRVALTVPGIGR